MNLFLKKLFRKPIYRIDVINWVTRHHKRYFGVCKALSRGLESAGLPFSNPIGVFPAHNLANASQLFGAEANTYWWPQGDWSGGCMEYLLWLHDQYKDDKEDLRRYKTNACK